MCRAASSQNIMLVVFSLFEFECTPGPHTSRFDFQIQGAPEFCQDSCQIFREDTFAVGVVFAVHHRQSHLKNRMAPAIASVMAEYAIEKPAHGQTGAGNA